MTSFPAEHFARVKMLFPKILAQYSSLVRDGEVIAVSGTLSTEEEKDAKILVNSVFRPGELPPAEPKREKKSSQKRGLYLKFSGSGDALVEKAKIITSIFEGDMPLYFYYEDEKKYHRMPRSEFVEVNDTMLTELKRLLGDKNVAVIY